MLIIYVMSKSARTSAYVTEDEDTDSAFKTLCGKLGWVESDYEYDTELEEYHGDSKCIWFAYTDGLTEVLCYEYN